MQFIQDIDSLKDQVDELRITTDALRVENERLRALLGCFDCDGYALFREKLLLPEMSRLAKLRMELPSDQVMLHERIVGQFNEVKMLSERRDAINEELQFNTLQLKEQTVLLFKAEAKFKKELTKRGEQ